MTVLEKLTKTEQLKQRYEKMRRKYVSALMVPDTDASRLHRIEDELNELQEVINSRDAYVNGRYYEFGYC